jgi:hypothetical protein
MTYKEADEKIKQLADDQFLAKLTEVFKLNTLICDDYEIAEFIKYIYQLRGLQFPDLELYQKTN